MRLTTGMPLVAGFYGCGFPAAHYIDYSTVPQESPTAQDCHLHFRLPCCLSWDCYGYKHCTPFCCCTPSKSDMLYLSQVIL